MSSEGNIAKPGWKVSHVSRIYFTCATGKEPKENIWKEGGPFKSNLEGDSISLVSIQCNMRYLAQRYSDNITIQ